MTLARRAASCSWLGQATIVCCSAVYSACKVESRLENPARMLDRTYTVSYSSSDHPTS